MWKLLLTVMVISDTGDISQSMLATDFADPAICRQLANLANQPTPDQVVNGHRITIKANGKCVPSGPVMTGQPDIGPPLAMLNGFINSFQRRY